MLPSSTRQRATLAALVFSAMLIVTAGCSIQSGAATSSAPSHAAPASVAPTTAAAADGASALCADLKSMGKFDPNDVQASLTFWKKAAADAPASISDQAQAVVDGFNKVAAGLSASDADNSNAINGATIAVQAWGIHNCKG